MAYTRKGPFVDVEHKDNPPAGAKKISAAYLNGVEDALVEQEALNATFATKQELADVEFASAGLTADPDHVGYYTVGSDSALTPDPDYPGYYLIGA